LRQDAFGEFEEALVRVVGMDVARVVASLLVKPFSSVRVAPPSSFSR
jgi:hypothetical protein